MITDSFIEAADKIKLQVKIYKAENAKANIIHVHGMGEHHARYIHVFEYLNTNNCNVITFDQRGHGKSEGQRGHSPSFERLLLDIDKVIQYAEAQCENLPLILYGHSMGGNLALNYLLRRKHRFALAIVTSPWLALAFQPPKWKLILAQIMQFIYPAYSEKSNLDVKAISNDSKVVEAYVKDPLVHKTISAGMFFQLYEAALWALTKANDIKIPLLLMHGNADKITSCSASEKFALDNTKNITFIKAEGGYHELHNEPNKEIYLQEITTFINSHL